MTGPIDRPIPYDGHDRHDRHDPHDDHDRHDRIDDRETRGAAEMNEQELGPEHPPQSTGSKYGTDAYRPADEYGTVVERPAQLGRLRTLTIVSLVLYLLSSVAAAIIAMDERLIAQSLRQSGMLTEPQIEEAIEGAVVGGLLWAIGTSVLVGLLYAAVIIGLSLARNWGRVLGIVLAILGILVMLFGLVTSLGSLSLLPVPTIASVLLTVVWLAATGWWLAVAFSAPLRRFFASSRASRG